MYAPQPTYPNFLPEFKEPDFRIKKQKQPSTRTKQPIVVGSSVLGLKYNGGVLLAADTLCSYGGLARFRDLRRIIKVGENTIVGVGGDYSDFQSLQRIFDDMVIHDDNCDDGGQRSPSEIHSFISRVMYNRRSKMDPLWNSVLIAGAKDNETFLGFVDLQGTSFVDDTLATGFGAHIARPLLRKAYRPDLTEEEARKVMTDCLRVLFYRDARTINRVQIASIGVDGKSSITDPFEMETEWRHGE